MQEHTQKHHDQMKHLTFENQFTYFATIKTKEKTKDLSVEMGNIFNKF